MNILLIASNNRFGDADAGFTHPYNLAKAFSRLGHDVTAIFKPHGNESASFKKDGIQVCITDWSARVSNLPRFVINFFKELNFLTRRKNEIDLIYERYELSRFSTGLISRMLKIPCAIEINTPVLDVRFRTKKIRRKILELIDKFHLSRFDFVITQTDGLAKIIQQRYKGNIQIIPNGADAELFKKEDETIKDHLKGQLKIKDKKIIGYLGAMMPWHGISDLLNAFKTLESRKDNYENSEKSAKKISNLALIIIGGTANELIELGGDTVKELIHDNKIIPLGKTGYTKVPDYLSICDTLVAPFNTMLDADRRELYERFGMWWCPIKIFEYLATDKPIVVPEITEIKKYLRNFANYYKEGDTMSLAKAINRSLLIKESSTKLERRKTYLKNNFTWEAQAKKIISLFEIKPCDHAK
jgi:glycosyltransferase involved in cell wall biosynthesis